MNTLFARLGTKIFAVIAFLAMVAVALAWNAIGALQNYDARVRAMQSASEAAVLGEKVNATILAVVMDSRGVYMADSVEEARKFATPLVASLRTLERHVAAWRKVAPAEFKSEMDQLSASTADFVRLREDLAKRGVEEGAAAARQLGDNEENRKNRSSLNAKLEAVSARMAEKVETLTKECAALYSAELWQTILIASIGVLTALLIAALVIVLAVTRPLSRMTETMRVLATGDLSRAVEGTHRPDEIGAMAKAVQVFKDSMIETQKLRAEQAEIEQRAEAERKRTMRMLADSFESSVQGVVSSVLSAAGQLQSSARGLSASAQSSLRQATAVAAASDQASINVQTVASASEQLAASSAEIGRQVTNATRIAGKAVEEAGRSDSAVQGLSASAQKIGKVVKLINDIAAQTNLLALNATIEAARAGEAGKGFAVVASEVKSLATQTAKATEEIGAQISEVQGTTDQAVSAIKRIGATIGEINQISTTIASAVEEQSAATQEIARNVQQAAQGTDEVSSNISGVTKAASETGSSADDVLGAAGELSGQAATLRREVDRFLASIRAA